MVLLIGKLQKKTSTFTAVSGEGYFVDTSGGAVTMNLPSSPSAGNIVAVKDYSGDFSTNNLTIGRGGSPINGGSAADVTINTKGASLVLVYVDGTQGWVATQDDESSFSGETYMVASGGNTIATCGNCKIHTFTSPGTFTVSSIASTASNNIVSYMVVAGGGGGGAVASGSYAAGGGGAGGFRELKNPVTPYTASPLDGYPSSPNRITVTATGFPITVGAGGTAGPPNSGTDTGGSGANSIFSTITSAGGGGGGAGASPGSNGVNGGSGGGAGSSPSSKTGGSGNTPPTTPAQGFDGGDSSGGHQPAAGGGGATTVGTDSTPGSGNPRAGGTGATTSITNSAVVYASGGPSGNHPGNPNSGGTATTGNGGGGGGGNGGTSGAGGSGIVIIRYKYQ